MLRFRNTPTITLRAFKVLGVLVVLGVLSVVSSPTPAAAQATRVDQLKYPPLRRFDVPQPQRVVLDNGLVVMLIEDHELPLVEATALVRTGARLEPAAQAGLADLTGDVLRTGGTTRMSGDQLDDWLESKAATIESSIGESSGRVTMSSLAKDFPDVLKVFADVLRHPAFAEEKLAVAKTQLEAGISRQNDEPQGILFREFNELIYGPDSPYTQEPTYASVAAIDRGDLAAWHQQYYHPNRVVLGLVGDFETEQALALVRQVFGDWKRGPEAEKVEVPYRTQPQPGIYFIDKDDMTQSNLAIGHLGVRRDDPDYYALEVLNQIMSGSGGSRLFSRIRTNKGLAYAVFGGVGTEWDHPGVFTLFMTTKTETTGAGLDALLQEMKNLTTSEPATDAEVERAKQAILNSFVFQSDTKREVLGQLLEFEYYGYPLDWLQRYQRGVEAVTTAQVRAAAAEHIRPSEFAVLVVGPSPEQGLDKPLSSYGTVVPVDISIPEPQAARAEATAETSAKGTELLDRALAAMGGAAKVDAIKSTRTAGTVAQQTPQGEMQIKTVSLYAAPGRYRQEITLPFGTVTAVLLPDGGFVVTPQGVQDLPASQREQLYQTAQRNPLVLLKARRDQGFTAVATGNGEVDGTPVELVQVMAGGEPTTLAIDPQTGRVLRVSYRGAGPTGAPGEIAKTYSDFREVGGIPFPFKVVESFDGQPASTTAIESIEVDVPVADDAFAKPQG